MSLIHAVFEALAAFLKWKAADAEIRLKRLKLDEYEKIEEEMEFFDRQIQKLRAEHKPESDALADRLRRKQAYRSLLLADVSASLPLPEKKSGHPNKSGDIHAENG